jgi:hypothetical protein
MDEAYNSFEYRSRLLLRVIHILQEIDKKHEPISIVELAKEKRDIDDALRFCGVY